MPSGTSQISSKGVIQKEHFIDALNRGIRLHIREKRLKGKRRLESEAALLLVHGWGAPAVQSPNGFIMSE